MFPLEGETSSPASGGALCPKGPWPALAATGRDLPRPPGLWFNVSSLRHRQTQALWPQIHGPCSGTRASGPSGPAYRRIEAAHHSSARHRQACTRHRPPLGAGGDHTPSVRRQSAHIREAPRTDARSVEAPTVRVRGAWPTDPTPHLSQGSVNLRNRGVSPAFALHVVTVG